MTNNFTVYLPQILCLAAVRSLAVLEFSHEMNAAFLVKHARMLNQYGRDMRGTANIIYIYRNSMASLRQCYAHVPSFLLASIALWSCTKQSK